MHPMKAALCLLGFASVTVVFAQTCGFVGGFPARFPGSCPSDAPVSCGVGAQPRCCPSGFQCVAKDAGYCCQPGQDCSQETLDHVQCPDPSWSIWAYTTTGQLGWCCATGFFGFALLDNSGVGCQPDGTTIDTASFHIVTQLMTTSATCISTPSATPTTASASTTTGVTTTSQGASIASNSEATFTPSSSSAMSGLISRALTVIAIGSAAVCAFVLL